MLRAALLILLQFVIEDSSRRREICARIKVSRMEAVAGPFGVRVCCVASEVTEAAQWLDGGVIK